MGIEVSHLRVRRSALIRALPGEIWEEFGSFESLNAWFGRGHTLHRFETKLGGRVDLSIQSGTEERHFGGPVIVWEPEREVTFESNWQGAQAWPVPTFMTIRLTPLFDATMVEIFHHGFERLGADAAEILEGYEDGWDVKHLKALREIVEP